MPLTDPPPVFIPPWDLHILRGQGPVRLGRLLWVNWARAANETDLHTYDDYASRYNDVEMRFRPAFNYGIGGDSYVGFGIELNRLTGVLTANAWPVANAAPANFIVEVTVANNGTGVNGVHFPTALLRVHLHRQVNRIWLTPRTLSVRRPDVGETTNTACAFTVRALFDDGVVGDITLSDQMTMLPANHFRRERVGTNWYGLQRIALPDTAANGTTVPITATTSAAWGNQFDDGQIQILMPWAVETDLPRAVWIDGNPRVLDGTRPPEDLPNVLFVSCGFLTDGTAADESGVFAAITDGIVQKMRTEKLLQPFGYLSDSINFWRLTIPGQDGGVSVRCEMYAAMRDGQLLAWRVPAADLPIGVEEWTLANLLYMAGLPVRADLALVCNKNTNQPVTSVAELQSLGAGRLDFSLLFQKWNAIMEPSLARNVLTTVAREWLMMAERTFVDEVNNFPGIMIGTPPSASPHSDELLQYDYLRAGVDDFAFFLLDHVTAAPRGNAPPITIRNPPGRILGNLWNANRSFIVALSNVAFGRANRLGSVRVRLYLATQDQKGVISGLPVQVVADRNSLALAPLPPRHFVQADTWRTVVHELGHSFGLGDEYIEHAETFRGAETDLDAYGNLTTPDTFLDSVHGTLNPLQIKWNWHRIRFASVITQITRVGTSRRFELHIRPRPVPWFLKDDIVLLRSRQRLVVINRNTRVSAPYIIEQVSAAGDVLTVAPTQANTDLAGFVAGSIVYKPVPGASASQFLRLISPAAERIMQIAIKGTMTGAACVIKDQMAHKDVVAQAPLKDDPLGHVSSKNLPRLVGAHFGGRGYACGVVHPSGHCMMRDSHDDSSSFCHVCRYVLVEQVDPEKHWLIDRDYDKGYPR
jgi:hypothetical protein